MKADHDTLVRLAATWLRRRARCTVVLANFQSVMTSEQPDAIGWRSFGWSIVIEAKASRADFRRDEHKPHRRAGRGMGQERWYIAPPGVVVAGDLDLGGRAEGWGLLEADVVRRRVVVARPSWPGVARHFDDEVCRRELPLLLAAMRRLDRTGSLASTDPLPPLTDGDLAVFEDRVALARTVGVEDTDEIWDATAALCAEVRRHRRASSG